LGIDIMSNGKRAEDLLMNRFVLGKDYVQGLRIKYPWVDRAISSGLRTKRNQSVYTMTVEIDGQHMVIPTIRRKRDKMGKPLNELYELSEDNAIKMSLKNRDFIPATSKEAAQYISHGLSNYLGNR